MGSPSSSPRQMPVKVTTAPTSVCPRVSARASAAASNGSCCRRLVAVMSLALTRRVGKGAIHRNTAHHMDGTAPCPRVLVRESTPRGHGARQDLRASEQCHRLCPPYKRPSSSASHGREERDLARARDRRIGAYMSAVD